MRTHRLRTALSALGMVIGVSSLVAVLAFGDGLERYVREKLDRNGLSTLRVAPRTLHDENGRLSAAEIPHFTAREVDEVRHLPGVIAVSLELQGSVSLNLRSPRRTEQASGIGVLANRPEVQAIDIASGRFFSDSEVARNAPVIVISHRLATQLSRSSSAEQIVGDFVRIGQTSRRVVGVLKPTGEEERGLVYVPIRAVDRSFIPGTYDDHPTMVVRTGAIGEVEAARLHLEDWVARRFGDPDEHVSIITAAQVLEDAQGAILVFKVIMGAITAIGLVVGGIGIMNVLLASVAERTREIGVRRALGARRREILSQFLVESVVIAAVGSVVGIALGLLFAIGLTTALRTRSGEPIYVSLSIGSVVAAVAAPVIVGLAAGMYPALLAADLSPVDAIRHE